MGIQVGETPTDTDRGTSTCGGGIKRTGSMSGGIPYRLYIGLFPSRLRVEVICDGTATESSLQSPRLSQYFLLAYQDKKKGEGAGQIKRHQSNHDWKKYIISRMRMVPPAQNEKKCRSHLSRRNCSIHFQHRSDKHKKAYIKKSTLDLD